MAKKFSYTNIASNLPEPKVTQVHLKGELFDGLVLNVKYRLSLTDMMSCITDIVDTIVDLETGTFDPEYKLIAPDMFIMHYYAGLPINKTGIAQAFRVLSETDLIGQLSPYVDQSQLKLISNAVEEKLSYYKELLSNTAAQRVTILLNGIENIFAQLGDATSALSEGKLQQLMDVLSRTASEKETALEESAENILKFPGADRNGKTH